MKYKIILLAFSAALVTSCSTYQAGQTPDDVYYSPAREGIAKKEVRNEERRDRYEDYVSSEDDQYLRRKIQNREKWSTIDDYSYWYDSRYNYLNDFSYNNYYGFNNFYGHDAWDQPYRYNQWSYNPWNMGYYGFNRFGNFGGFGGYYSPMYTVVSYKNPRVYAGNTSKSNLSSFYNRNYSNQNSSPNNYSKGRNSDNSNFGSLMKGVFTSPSSNAGNNQQSASWDRPVRTIEPSATPSSSAGGRSGGYNSSGSSAPASRGPR